MEAELENRSSTAQRKNTDGVAGIRLKVDNGDRPGHGGSLLRLRLNEYDKDDYKEQRQANHKCKACAYLPADVMVMWAFTSSACKKCGESFYSPSSDVDQLCEACANDLNWCKHCTQPMD